jgi:hypothetical protein
VKCTHDTMAMGVSYLSGITCNTDLSTLEQPATAASCINPFARCPEYAGEFQ